MSNSRHEDERTYAVPKVFINYRAREQAGYAALLDRELVEHFGRDNVFRASRSIEPGDDFAEEIIRNLRMCTVLLAVIGPDWLTRRTGAYREPVAEDDWVHKEIAEALRAGVRVIPILVEDARMPSELDLPAEIAPLARCQYLRLHHRSVDNDIGRVVAELDRLFPELRRVRRPREVVDELTRLFQLAAPLGSPCHIGVLTGTINRIRSVDIWVNSENTDMEMSRFMEFSVSSIIRYWGSRRDHTGRVTDDVIADELAAVVGHRRPVAPGTALVTGSGSLAGSNNVRHVIHVAAVQGEPGAGFRQVRQVGSCVANALHEAERLAAADPRVRSILFPLLGVGVAGAALAPTVRTLLRAAIDHLAATPDTALRAIYFLAYTEAELAALDGGIEETRRLTPVTATDRPPGR
jgi:O-acetyl-ADP-ribose deacetylase (regulator of RNase III)